MLLIFEGALVFFCGTAALYIRYGREAYEMLVPGQGWLKILVAMFVVQGTFYLFDLYDFHLIRRRSVLYLNLVQAIGLASIIHAAMFYALPRMALGRGTFLMSIALMLMLMTCWRIFVMWVMGHPRLAERVLILGTGPNAINIASETLDRREHGYKIVGFIGDDPALVGRSLINPSVIGVFEDLEEIVHRLNLTRIVIAIDDQRGKMPVDMLLRLKLRDRVVIEESASYYERLTGKVSTRMLRPSWLIFSSSSRVTRMYRRLVCVTDIALSVIGLLLSWPLVLLAAIAIKIESSGPVFYIQERVGLHDKVFKLIKLRSMRTDAEQDGPRWADENDSRVTRVGRMIRNLRIDELPQFINVIRGDMSFIGPRPERPVFVRQLEREIPYYSQRHLVKPGVTGWAQVCYPYGSSVEDAREKLQYDLYYIKNQSPVLDAFILLETARIMIFGRGAR